MIGDINQLPEECISHVIGFTSPRDACVVSAVSPAFRSAADSDTTWQRFLPADCASILSRAVEPVQYGSQKALFFRLCDDPVLIDGGKMSFGLERSTGAKCFMISARALIIVWSDDERYWKWIPISESRFQEGAELLNVCWLEIRGKIERKILSPHTAYTTHLIFKLAEGAYGLQSPPQEAIITIGTQIVSNHPLCVQWQQAFAEENEEIGVRPKERGDGWMEIEMGEFWNEERKEENDGEDREVEMRLMGMGGGHWKKGLVIQGIEIRPKS